MERKSGARVQALGDRYDRLKVQVVEGCKRKKGPPAYQRQNCLTLNLVLEQLG